MGCAFVPPKGNAKFEVKGENIEITGLENVIYYINVYDFKTKRMSSIDFKEKDNTVIFRTPLKSEYFIQVLTLDFNYKIYKEFRFTRE